MTETSLTCDVDVQVRCASSKEDQGGVLGRGIAIDPWALGRLECGRMVVN